MLRAEAAGCLAAADADCEPDELRAFERTFEFESGGGVGFFFGRGGDSAFSCNAEAIWDIESAAVCRGALLMTYRAVREIALPFLALLFIICKD